uniref:Uncharacterized protein n=1 Tax=Rhizophora mucronata TaxID=61149 RepID=A0A2P2IJS9_RHIMU
MMSNKLVTKRIKHKNL